MQEQPTLPAGGVLPRAATPLRYRADIDGLRAVAVLLVIAEHLRTSCSGGFIGVDVFFVISGYLISAILLQEFDREKFSLLRFYERRIRRILPALAVVLVFTTVLAPRYLLPAELVSYAQSEIAAIFSVSNMLFWRQAGYFDAPSNLKPLLHTWSLAVEEQFYLFFPLFLMAARRWFWSRLRAALWICFAVSFAAAAVIAWKDGSTAFYLAPLRTWELLTGTLLSQRYLPTPKSSAARHVSGLAGLLLIVVPAWLYSADTIFPGVSALAPVMGAALVIAAGENGPNAAGRILGWRPVVTVGLMSYSLYLWHWPILTFQRLGNLLVNAQDGSHKAKIAVFSASLLAGLLSWRFVERPFRQGRYRPSRQRLSWIAGTSVALLSGGAVGLIASHGLPQRFPPAALALARYADAEEYATYREDVCFLGAHHGFSAFQSDVCLPKPDADSILLVGDSHAADLYPGLRAAFPGRSILQANYSSCLPLMSSAARVTEDCRQMRRAIFGDFLQHQRVPVVVLSGRWDGSGMADLKATVDWLKGGGMTPVVVGPSMEYSSPLPRLLALSILDRDPAMPGKAMLLAQRQVDRQMQDTVAGQWGVRYISVFADLCRPPGECPSLAAPGVPLMFDTDHFTAAGSRLLAERIRAAGQLPGEAEAAPQMKP